MNLANQRCLHHATREAACRCPQCRNYYCRECVTEHDGRFICVTCLKTSAGARVRPKSRIQAVAAPLSGLLIAWAFYAVLAWVLLNLP